MNPISTLINHWLLLIANSLKIVNYKLIIATPKGDAL